MNVEWTERTQRINRKVAGEEHESNQMAESDRGLTRLVRRLSIEINGIGRLEVDKSLNSARRVKLVRKAMIVEAVCLVSVVEV
jgi:hypothetical protein